MHNWKNLHRLRGKKKKKTTTQTPKLLLILSQARLSVRILNSFRANAIQPREDMLISVVSCQQSCKVKYRYLGFSFLQIYSEI